MKVERLAREMGFFGKKGYIDNLEKTNKLDIPAWIKRSLNLLKPDAFYFDNYEGINNPVFILFFENIEEDEIKSLHKKIWNFNMAPIVIIINDKELRLYNGLSYDYNRKFLGELSLDIDNFNYLKLRTGKAWEMYKEFYQDKDRVDYNLLNNVEVAIKRLEKSGLNRLYANSIIGRLIFTRYLIDRDLFIEFPYIKNKIDKRQGLINTILDKDRLYAHFDFLKEKFNGDLFPVSQDERKKVSQTHLEIINSLFRGINLKNGQINLFEVYDFSIIPIELISNIYERFIGEEMQKTNKAFYTPLFLVDYIISDKIQSKIREENKIKVLDPSCGSGIFLVETFRKIIEGNLAHNGRITAKKLKELLIDCIYGIDIDENAVNIAIFSIYLTLLDYLNPEEVSSFKFPVLKGRNFYVDDFFDLKASFNKELKNKKIDFIIGNPPWGSKKGSHLNYTRKKKIPVSDNQIAQSYIVRASDFGFQDTIYSFIVTSKILYNLNGDKFRRYFLNNYILEEVFDLSIVRKIIFNKAIGPAAILSYRDADNKNANENIVRHISIKPGLNFKMFKTVVIEKNDIKMIKQKYFLDYDWIWKVLLYGNYLDFNFIKRLKELNTLQDVIEENDLEFGVGFTTWTGHNNEYKPELGNGDYLYVTTKHLSKITFSEDSCPINKIKYYHRSRNEEIYKAPHLLIKRGIKKVPDVAYSNKNAVFTNSIYGLSGKKEQENIVKNIGAYLLSEVCTYFLFLQASQWGVERDEVYKGEYLSLPVNQSIIKSFLWKSYNKAIKKIRNDEELLNGFKNRTQLFYKKINEEISDILDLNNKEMSLINYVTEVSIPLFRDEVCALRNAKEGEIKEYTDVLMKHFKKSFENINKCVQADIYLDQYFICVYISIGDYKDKEEKNIRISNDYTIERLVNRIGTLSYEQLTSELFIRKDIKGFEKNGFYVIKPNEYKNWHKAAAYMDISEIMDAMISSGKKKVNKEHV